MSPYTIPRAPRALPREARLVAFIEKVLEQHQEEHLGSRGRLNRAGL
jgi:hypothetical protein